MPPTRRGSRRTGRKPLPRVLDDRGHVPGAGPRGFPHSPVVRSPPHLPGLLSFACWATSAWASIPTIAVLGHSAAQERGDVVHDDDHDEHDQDLGSESARECPFRSAMLLIVESAGTQIPALYVVRRPFESANEMHCGTLDQARHWSYS
jgi:hypothetical protein